MSEQKERFLRHNAFARRLSVGPPYLTKLRQQGRAVRDETTGTYDVQHPVNNALLVAAASTKAPEPTPEVITDAEMVALQREKLRYERDRTREQSKKYAIQNETLLGSLVEMALLRQALGIWGAAVSTNILTVGQRVARGDHPLQERIDTEVTRALKAAVNQSEKQIMALYERHGVEVTDDDDDTD